MTKNDEPTTMEHTDALDAIEQAFLAQFHAPASSRSKSNGGKDKLKPTSGKRKRAEAQQDDSADSNEFQPDDALEMDDGRSIQTQTQKLVTKTQQLGEKKGPRKLPAPEVVVFDDSRKETGSRFGARAFLSSKVSKVMDDKPKTPLSAKEEQEEEGFSRLDSHLSTLLTSSGLLDPNSTRLDLGFLKTLEEEQMSTEDKRRQLQRRLLASGAEKTAAQRVPGMIRKEMIRAEEARIEKRLELAKDSGLISRSKSRHGKMQADKVKGSGVDIVELAKGNDGVHLHSSKRLKPSKVTGVVEKALQKSGLVRKRTHSFKAPTEKSGVGKFKDGALHISKREIVQVAGRGKGRKNDKHVRPGKERSIMSVPGMPKKKR